MSEIQDAVQILQLSIQGVEVCFRLRKELLKVLQKLIKFLSNMLFQEKLLGKTNMKQLLKQGVDLEACQIPENRMPEFKKLAKKYGILYTEVPGGKNGMTDIIFRREDIARMNLLYERMGLGNVAPKDIVDYVKDMPEERLHDIAPDNPEVYPSQEIEDRTKKVETSKETYDDRTMEKMQGFHSEMEDIAANFQQNKMNREEFNQAVQNIQFQVLSNHPSYEEIHVVTRNKEGKLLMVDETKEQIKVRIPYEMDKFIWLNKKEAFLSGDREKITAFLRRDREYPIVDRNNQTVEVMKGRDLRNKHFTPVKRKKQEHSQDRKKQQSRNQRQTQQRTGRSK